VADADGDADGDAGTDAGTDAGVGCRAATVERFRLAPSSNVASHISTAIYPPIIRLSAAIAAGTLEGRRVPSAAITAAKLTEPPM